MDFMPTKYWTKVDNAKVRCDVCPRACLLQDGQRGLCFVRMARAGEIVLTTYGRSSGFAVDPIEKKPLNHFYPSSKVLSFGTAGCNLTCKFCQNWDMSKAREMDILQHQASPEMIAKAALANGCKSVAYTYNDPVIFLEYALDVAQACHEYGVKNVAVTAGYVEGQAREDFFRPMDATNVDLKAFSDDFYRKTCGGKLQTVLDTLLYLKNSTQIWVELTTLLIPGENDSEQELDQMTRWVVDNLGSNVPMHFSAFHPDYKMRHLPRTPAETLSTARQIALDNGVAYAYTGNVHDKSGESTYCAECGEVLIGRDWYVLSEMNLTDEGCCGFCGSVCDGVF